ncbi:flagellar biosynthesis protein FlhB [Helicobacter kayseriensis]|uniref:flagellar biosynthesis protein FlhB n=1 Tax=Helicobacter kayseriensis TaxID=2905877 RepID=UPI001E3B1B60|nr:flagellar biosynthesis protein FlhB [Helicobacter kayseriensis]MCE3047159.1 flagellar biosynthesis protein FlhB [Helicobacter kayseriensis]MCE3048530.1 flagellar biosynthesis protein FlhB [Helicobacter kayseriensis]
MASDEEKTEAPSARKIAKAREEGNVAKSPEVIGFLGLMIGLSLVFFLFSYWLDGVQRVYFEVMRQMKTELSIQDALNLFLSLTWQIFLLVSPIFLALIVGGVFGNIFQFGLLFAPKVIIPKFSKINPLTGIKNVISLKKLIEGMFITFKVLLAFSVGFLVFLSFLDEIPLMSRLDIFSQMVWFRNKAILLIGVLLVLFAILSLTDFLIKKYQYTKSLRMSKKEIKDEHKQQEGSPEVKQKIRQMQMKAAMNRMMKNIPSASVVVTNPTHYAVALRFNKEDKDKFGVPIVVAKGIDHLAIRIKSIAREHDIQVIENPPLARELYARIEIEYPIEDDLFVAVAALLKEVIRLEKLQGKNNRFEF